MKTAVIGAGVGGLAAAYDLARAGHEVTVFDSFAKPGGMMRYGIPNYRLPEERLDKDVNHILDCGVTFKGDTTIGKDITMEIWGHYHVKVIRFLDLQHRSDIHAYIVFLNCRESL